MNVLLLWESNQVAQTLAHALAHAGCTVLGPYSPSSDLQEVLSLSAAELIIIQTDAAERDTLEHIVTMSQSSPRPIVMVTDGEGANAAHAANTARLAAAAGISAYVSVGFAPERVESILQMAIAQFEGMNESHARLRAEISRVRQELSERKQIERAKGLLMLHLALTEEQAYRQLQLLAMQQRISLAEASKLIFEKLQLNASHKM